MEGLVLGVPFLLPVHYLGSRDDNYGEFGYKLNFT